MPHCPVFSEYCIVHGFVHGAEAEELRAGVERILETVEDTYTTHRLLRRLLDKVDARDSLAFVEARRVEGATR